MPPSYTFTFTSSFKRNDRSSKITMRRWFKLARRSAWAKWKKLEVRVARWQSAQRLDVKLRAAGWRPASRRAPLAAHPIMPVQVARRRANSRRGSRLRRREKRGRTVNFNDELAGILRWCLEHVADTRKNLRRM